MPVVLVGVDMSARIAKLSPNAFVRKVSSVSCHSCGYCFHTTVFRIGDDCSYHENNLI